MRIVFRKHHTDRVVLMVVETWSKKCQNSFDIVFHAERHLSFADEKTSGSVTISLHVLLHTILITHVKWATHFEIHPKLRHVLVGLPRGRCLPAHFKVISKEFHPKLRASVAGELAVLLDVKLLLTPVSEHLYGIRSVIHMRCHLHRCKHMPDALVLSGVHDKVRKLKLF